MTNVSALAALLSATITALVPTTYAATLKVDWKIPGVGKLPDMPATVGDTAVFEWSYFHNVFFHPSGDCDETGAISVGSSSGASYTFTADDVGEMVFACDVGNHCEIGQIMTFTVSAASPSDASTTTDTPTKAPTPPPTAAKKVDADVVIEWSVPSNGEPLPAKTAKVGDVVRFDWKWKGAHNVFVHPSGDCNETDAVLVGDESVTTASYTFTDKDAGKDVVFACDVSSHCEKGQIVTFSVSSSEDPGEKSGGVSFDVTGALSTLLTALMMTRLFL